VAGRPAAEAARGGGGVRAPPRRRARPAARSGQRQPARAQFRRLAAAAGAGGVLGPVRAARDGDGAHARHAGFTEEDPGGARRRHSGAGARRGGDFLHPGLSRRVFPRRHAPGQHPGGRRRPLRRARLRHHGYADRGRQELPGAELHRLLQPGLQARGPGASRRRLGARRHARRRVRNRDPRGVRADLRPAAEGDLFRPAAAAPVPDLAPLQRRGPAAARAAAEDAAQHRGPGTRARPRPRPVADRQAVPRALDARAGGVARPAAQPAARGAVLGRDRAADPAPRAPGAGRGAQRRAAGRPRPPGGPAGAACRST